MQPAQFSTPSRSIGALGLNLVIERSKVHDLMSDPTLRNLNISAGQKGFLIMARRCSLRAR